MLPKVLNSWFFTVNSAQAGLVAHGDFLVRGHQWAVLKTVIFGLEVIPRLVFVLDGHAVVALSERTAEGLNLTRIQILLFLPSFHI
jgi:hypothetical protein